MSSTVRGGVQSSVTTPIDSRVAGVGVEGVAERQSRHKFAALVLISSTLLVLVVLAVGAVGFCVVKRRRRKRRGGHGDYSAAGDG